MLPFVIGGGMPLPWLTRVRCIRLIVWSCVLIALAVETIGQISLWLHASIARVTLDSQSLKTGFVAGLSRIYCWLRVSVWYRYGAAGGLQPYRQGFPWADGGFARVGVLLLRKARRSSVHSIRSTLAHLLELFGLTGCQCFSSIFDSCYQPLVCCNFLLTCQWLSYHWTILAVTLLTWWTINKAAYLLSTLAGSAFD